MVNANLMVWQVSLIDPPSPYVSATIYIPLHSSFIEDLRGKSDNLIQ